MRLVGAQLAYQIPGFDAHGATLGAKTRGGTGVYSLILIGFFQLAGIYTRALFGLNVTPDYNALTWAQGQAVRRTHRFAEAAFNALVDNLVSRRQRFEVLQMDAGVFRQHHIRIQNALWIQQALYFPHQLVGICAPLQLPALAWAPITPGCRRIRAPLSRISRRFQPSPSTISNESLMAWPDRLVPAARKVTGTLCLPASCSSATTSCSAFTRTTSFGIRR